MLHTTRAAAPPPGAADPASVSVFVLNSTKRNGIAKATKQVLSSDGFKVTER